VTVAAPRGFFHLSGCVLCRYWCDMSCNVFHLLWTTNIFISKFYGNLFFKSHVGAAEAKICGPSLSADSGNMLAIIVSMPISISGKPIVDLNHGTVFQPMDGNEFCSPLSALCTGSPLDMNKPHLIVLDRWNQSFQFKEQVPFKFENKNLRFNIKWRHIDWYYFWPLLNFIWL
jgi:hypothetical protein